MRVWAGGPDFDSTFGMKDVEGYKCDSFCAMVTAVDRHPTEKEYKRSIILEKGFKSWQQILKEKARLLYLLVYKSIF